VYNDDIMTEIKEYNEKEVIAERRKTQFKTQFDMRLRGYKRGEIREKLAEDYGVSPNTIDQDWQRRKDWLLEVVGVTDVMELVATTVGRFNLTQGFRKDVFETLLDLSDKLSGGDGDMEVLPAVWGMMMKLLNDIDAAEKTKSDILTKLGILKEAPKRVEVHETKVEHKIDWTKITEHLDDEGRRKLFDEISEVGSGIIDIDVEDEQHD